MKPSRERPLAPEILADALQDRIHPASGRLLAAKPINTSRGTKMKPPTCTCDTFCDDPCPVHWRLNDLQNEVIFTRAKIVELTAERDEAAELLHLIWRDANDLFGERASSHYRSTIAERIKKLTGKRP